MGHKAMMLSDVWRLSVWRLLRTSGRRAACAAGRLHGAYWPIGPGSAGPARPAWLKAAAARFRCRPGRGISWRPPAYSLLCIILIRLSLRTHP